MSIIPATDKVFMVTENTNTTYGGSAALQAMSEWYTMQDIIDTVESTIPVSQLYSATFLDTTTQNNGGATVANQARLSSTQNANGFTLGPDNRINVVNAGTYYIDFSAQLDFTGGATAPYNVTVWYTVDDTIVTNSAFTFTTTGGQNDQTLARITDTIALTAGQYIKFYWWSAVTGMKLLATAAGTNPTRPLSPSVNVSIFNVG